MRNRHRGLAENQARRGIGERDPPSDGLPRQRVVVDFRIVAAQRQLEPVLPGERTVTGALIAARLRQHRDHVIAEAPAIVGRLISAHMRSARTQDGANAFFIGAHSRKQFSNRLDAAIDDRNRTALRARQLGLEVDAEAL